MKMKHHWSRMSRVATAFAVGVIGVLAVSDGASAQVKSHASSSTVSIRLSSGDYDTLNPAITGTYGGAEMAEFLYDRLVALNSQSQPVPYLASSWTVAGSTVTLNIRQGATCSDGTAVTPSVVAASLTYFSSPTTAAFPAPLVFGPAGVKSITSSDSAGTVTIVLNKPFSGIIAGLANPAASIICPAGLANLTSLKDTSSGSGPYTVTSSNRNSQYVLTLRPGYNWGPAGTDYSTMPTTIDMDVIATESTAANELIGGTLDVGNVVGRDDVRLKAESSLQEKISGSLPTANALLFNEHKGLPFADPYLRKAVAMVVNVKDFNEAYSFGLDKVIHTMMTPGMTCYNPADAKADIPTATPKAAEALLLEHGYKKGSNGFLEKNGKQLDIRIVDPTFVNDGDEYLQSALESIGIKATVSVTDTDAYVNTIYTTGAWDLQLYGFAGPFPTIPLYLAIQVEGAAPPKGINVGWTNNPTFNALAAKAENSAGSDCGVWDAAERALLSRADVVPLSVYDIYWFGSKSVNFDPSFGVSINPFTLSVK